MKKRAILFGMNNYNGAQNLPGTEADVRTLEKRLCQLQFETTSYIDLCLNDLERRIHDFAIAAPCDSLNIIYFSGHGGHSKGENYLLPIDFLTNVEAGLSIEDSSLNLKKLYPSFTKEVKLLIIIDACRTDLTPSYIGDFSEMASGKNTYIAYATQFGSTATGTNHMSFFTEALCENILTPNLSIDQLFVNVRAALYLKYGKQISNSVTSLTEYVTLNEQTLSDDIGEKVLQFVDKYGDMYVDKYGCFAGDDLLFIDAAQYCNISVLDAICKYQKIDAERYHIADGLSESHKKLISFWNMLDHGLTQDEFYTWQYRGRPIRLGEIPPLPLDMQRPMPEAGKEIDVDFKVETEGDATYILTNLPDNFQFFGKINDLNFYENIIIKDGRGRIPLNKRDLAIQSLDLHSVAANVTGVDYSVVGDRCRNLVGKYVKFHPIHGIFIEFHYKK